LSGIAGFDLSSIAYRDPSVSQGDTAGDRRNESAPAGKELKYAHLERERRFLLAGSPSQASVGQVAITDRYVTGTRLRVRQMVDMGGAGRPVTYKLTQKVPAPTGQPGLITTIYLDAVEFEVLARLPARTLRKVRHSIPPIGVDEFQGALSGLYLAESEFGSEEASQAFSPPVFAVAEVTADPRFTGGWLANASRQDVLQALAGYGVHLHA
jgi:CYTH domain-containing protein